METFKSLVVALVLCLVANSAFGAGGPWLDNNSLGGSFNLGGDYSYTSSHSNTDDGGGGGAYFRITLDPEVASFNSADWNFNVSTNDPMFWTAECSLYGDRESSEAWPSYNSWSQNVSKGLVYYEAYLSFISEGEKFEPANGLIDDPYMEISGNISVLPGVVSGSAFSVWETTRDQYTWPNGYHEDPVVVQVPVWRGDFNIYGQFLGDTPEAARAVGRSYLNAVPEPSTWILLLSGLGSVILFIRRRR